MADKEPSKPASKTEAATPAPVDIKSSIPIDVQIAPESLASLGAPPAGTAEPVAAAPTPTAPTGTPVNVTVLAPPPAPVIVPKAENLTLAPTTTAAADEVARGQRHINRLWEWSQATIAIGVTAVTVYVMAVMALRQEAVSANQVLLIGMLNVMTTLILTSYFTRVNHEAIGGVGAKPPQEPYTGR